MNQALRTEAFTITAVEGRILLDAPGLVGTLDAEAASVLADRLLAACHAARLQQAEMLHDDRPIDWI